jgi:ATP-dependent exoDNAse (exonuclease V) alpha subunit
MMIVNDQEHRRWVNGTLGIVSKLTDNVIIVTINGTDYEISRSTFNKYKCEYNRDEKKIEYLVETSVNQFPLILAYAITIHKSQGMTYQQIAVNIENCFAPGQAYVALSRCANFDKLYLTKKINPSCIITDNTVVNFYNKVKEKVSV